MGATARKDKSYSFSEYIEFEQSTNEKHDFYYGEVYNLAGGTIRHSQIIFSSSNILHKFLTKKNCITLTNDVKLELDKDQFYVYPDVIVTCDNDDLSDNTETIIKNPLIIVEILSDSTELYDRNIKKHYYLKLPSLKYYLLISQKETRIEMYEKIENRIEYSSYETPEQEINFQQLGFKIKIADIYTKQVLNK
ncbi:MAG: Uma2 family endonuclease [Bacteroidota bacterium]